MALANAIVTVPINPDFGSLNLAQAVILLAYEWSKRSDIAQPPAKDLEPPALHGELEGLIGQLDEELEAKGYFHPRRALKRPGIRSEPSSPRPAGLRARSKPFAASFEHSSARPGNAEPERADARSVSDRLVEQLTNPGQHFRAGRRVCKLVIEPGVGKQVSLIASVQQSSKHPLALAVCDVPVERAVNQKQGA